MCPVFIGHRLYGRLGEATPTAHGGHRLDQAEAILQADRDGLPLAGTRAHSALMASHAQRPRRRYDWPAIRARYVEGHPEGDRHVWPTLAEVAEHFNVSQYRVREVSASERWPQLRASQSAELEAERRRARTRVIATTAAELDAAAASTADLGMRLTLSELDEMASDPAGPIDTHRLLRLARAADRFFALGQRALGTRLHDAGRVHAPDPVGDALRRDDPERLAAVLAILAELDLDPACVAMAEPPAT